MAVLTEIQAVGKKWIRANKIQINNALDQKPTITWSIEKAIEIDNEIITTPVTEITIEFNQDEKIPIRNPLTGELTGQTITKGEIYAMIYSTFWVDAKTAGVVDVG